MSAPSSETAAPEARVARLLVEHTAATLATGFVALGIASGLVLLGNLGLWLAGQGLHVQALPAPGVLLPFSLAGWRAVRAGGASRAVQHALFLGGATVPSLALLVNLLHDPLEAARASDLTIWLFPFCIAATVLTLDRALSLRTAAWCASQYAGIHALAAFSPAGAALSGEVHAVDGLVRVGALLLIGVVAGQANQRAREAIVRLVGEEQRAHAASLTAVRAEERQRAAAAFLARMSHELKTPLHVILGNMQLLASRGGLERAQLAQVEAARLSGQHLLGLIEALLDQGRIAADQALPLSPQPVGLDLILDQVAGMLRGDAAARGLQLVITRDLSAPARLSVDPVRLRQVLLNLLDNGLKYTQRGEVRLRVRASERPDEVVFEVNDTGRGIAADELERVFEPFFRGAASADVPTGVGLGLPITRALVAAMGGRLTLGSEPGVGTWARFSLFGAAPAEEAPAIQAPSTNDAALPAPVRARLRAWAERGNMARLRQEAEEAAAGDPALRPTCERLCAAADTFDDVAALRILAADPGGDRGPGVASTPL